MLASVECELLFLQPRDCACGSHTCPGRPSLYLCIAASPDGHKVELGLMAWMSLQSNSLYSEFAFLSLTIEKVLKKKK